MRSLFLGLVMALAVSVPTAQLATAATSDEATAKAIASQLKESGRLKDYRGRKVPGWSRLALRNRN